MNPRKFALIGGTVMLVLGLLAFIAPGARTADLPALNLDSSYGYFLGFLPMNIINKLVLVVLGVTGIMAANRPTTSLPASIHWSRWVMGITLIGTVLGLIPSTNTVGGYWPLFGNDIWVHAIMAVMGAYFGFVLPSRAAKALGPIDKSRIAA